jgi:hypothetical protein
VDVLTASGFELERLVEREAYQGVEAETRRFYVLATNTGRTARSRTNLLTNSQRRASPSQHDESTNTHYWAASSTNTKPQHDHRSCP